MKRFLTLALAGALVLGMGSVAYANICAFDPVPAATLLFPFVPYNYDNAPSGTTTRFSVTNVSADAQIVHVTIWTDYSVAVLDFNILLTGYDTQMLNIRDILRDGQLPVTYHSTYHGNNSDPIEGMGPWSAGNTDADGAPANIPASGATAGLTCDTANPEDYTTPIDPGLLGSLQAWLQSSQTADRAFVDCDGFDLSPQPNKWFVNRTTADDTWMYITMDVVNACNTLFPDESGYFGTAGYAMNDNVLVGDYQVLDLANRLSEVDNAVHIEADPQIGTVVTAGPNGYPTTFYARYSNFRGVSDYREPLPTAWAVRYENFTTAAGKAIKTYLRVFKASTRMAAAPIVPDLDASISGSLAYELFSRSCLAYTYYAWDEEENINTTQTTPYSHPGGGAVIPNLLPLETQEVDAAQFNLVGNTTDGYKGWMLFVWPASNGAYVGETPYYYQTWMGVKYTQEGDYSGSRDAQVMANYNCFSDQVLPDLGINYDYVP